MSLNADMSLDDIISSNKSNFSTRRGSGFNRGRGSRRGSKPNFSRGSGNSRQSRPKNDRYEDKGDYVRGNMNDQWSHDLYSEGADEHFTRNSMQSSRRASSKLLITNLHFDVTDNDIEELFSPFGAIKKSGVNYDSSGRSKCSAFVEFVKFTDAKKAQSEYNGVQLDGMPLKIELAADSFSQPPPKSLKRLQDSGSGSWNRQSNDRSSFRDRRGRGRSDFSSRLSGRKDNRRGGNRREKTKQPTTEELDAELDAYIGQAQKMSID